MAYELQGELVASAFVIDDVQYPANVLDLWRRADLEALGLVWVDPFVLEPHVPTAEELCAQVDQDRDARIDGGFNFLGQRFQSRPSDRENIMGASQLAIAAMGQGAGPGNLRWADPDKDFVWITADNDLAPLDAPSTVALFQAGVAFKSALTFYARGLKDALLAAEDPNSIDIETGWPE